MLCVKGIRRESLAHFFARKVYCVTLLPTGRCENMLLAIFERHVFADSNGEKNITVCRHKHSCRHLQRHNEDYVYQQQKADERKHYMHKYPL